MSNKLPRDDFDTFLRQMQTNDKAEDDGQATVRIVHALFKLGETDVIKLMTMVNISWSEFTASVTSLREAGLIDMDEHTQLATVRLTAEGSRWAVAMGSPAEGKDV